MRDLDRGKKVHTHVNVMELVWESLKRFAFELASSDAAFPSDETCVSIVHDAARSVAPDLMLRKDAVTFYAAELRDMVKKARSQYPARS